MEREEVEEPVQRSLYVAFFCQTANPLGAGLGILACLPLAPGIVLGNVTSRILLFVGVGLLAVSGWEYREGRPQVLTTVDWIRYGAVLAVLGGLTGVLLLCHILFTAFVQDAALGFDEVVAISGSLGLAGFGAMNGAALALYGREYRHWLKERTAAAEKTDAVT